MTEVKLSYTAIQGQIRRAYIDLESGFGNEIFTDEPVKIAWSDAIDGWIEERYSFPSKTWAIKINNRVKYIRGAQPKKKPSKKNRNK